MNNLCFFPAVIGAVRKLKADIILECFTAPISTLFTPLVTDIPVVAKPTSFEAERFRQLYHLPFDWVEKAGCKFYGYFAAGNISDEEKMRRYNPNIKIKLVAEGVSDEYFQIPRQKPKYILCLGRIDISQKGLDLLLSAYASIRNSVGWKLMIAGHGPDTVKLRALIKSYDMEKEIEIAGPVYGEKKRQILAEAAFVVLPSRREGFCLFALEALAAGLPIVCFDIPGLAWITADAAAKAKPFDAAEFSKKILEFAGNAEHRELAGRQARALAGNYSWDKTAENMENFFLDVLADKNKYEK